MKFTPEQVEQLLAESGANCVRSNPSQADEVYEAYFYELTRLCTLAADRALEPQAARIAELERARTGYSTVYNEAMDSLRIAVAERDQLRAEVERLRKDGERMGCPPEGYQLVPHEPTDALLRPFYNCPPDELQHAWSSALRVARVAMYRQREAEEYARAIEAAKEAK